MLLTDKKEFSKGLRDLMAIYNKPAEPNIFEMWFSLLTEYDLADIKQAFAKYAQNEKYPPVPAGVIEYLPKQKVLTAEEAWSHVPKFETDSAWVTSRMMGALGVAEELIASGDSIGARIAFTRSYDNTEEVGEWFYSEAYGVSFEDKKNRKVQDYKLLENKGWLPKSEKIEQLLIESGSQKTLTKSGKKQVSKLRLITNEMPCLNQSDTGQEKTP